MSDALVAEWRQGIIRRAYLMWHGRKIGRRLKPLPPGWTKRQRRALDVLWDLMQEPWFRVGLATMSAYTALVLWSARELLLFPRLFSDSPSAMGSGPLCYAHAKLGLATRPPRPSWNAWDLNPWHAAALNAVSPDATQTIYERLDTAVRSSKHRQIDAVLGTLEAVGRDAIAAHGAWLYDLDLGPPRGLMPFMIEEFERLEAAEKRRQQTAVEAPEVVSSGVGKMRGS